MKIIRAKDYENMSRKAANILSSQVVLKPNSILGLATGSSPIGMYKKLIEWHKNGDIDFSKIKTFNLDEYVGLDKEHPQSYYKFMRENFFNGVNIDEENISIPCGMTDDNEKECVGYEEKVAKFGGIDLQVLGIGHNGHIGFNEPDKCFEKDTHVVDLSLETREANSRFFESIEEVPTKAISMGMGIIMNAKKIVLLCSGKDKAKILHKSLFGEINPYVPASILQLHPDVTIVADQEALEYIK